MGYLAPASIASASQIDREPTSAVHHDSVHEAYLTVASSLFIFATVTGALRQQITLSAAPS